MRLLRPALVGELSGQPLGKLAGWLGLNSAAWLLALVGLSLCSAPPAVASEPPAYQTRSILLLQPEPLIAARVNSADELAGYLLALGEAAAAALASENPAPAGGFLVAAVRPGQQARIWLDLQPALPGETAARLTAALQAVEPMAVRRGTVLLALNASLWGGVGSTEHPHPAEWRVAAQERSGPIDVEQLVDQVWPTAATATTPAGFVLQPLEETDGSILRPQDWHFRSAGTTSSWAWSISEDEPRNGGYSTGLRIQLLVGVSARTGQSRQDFVEQFLERTRRSAEVIQDCEVEALKGFRRRCLEVLQPPSAEGQSAFRVLYTLTWFEQLDLVAVATFGSPPEHWDDVAEARQMMSEVVLIGPNFGREETEGDSP